MRISLAVSSRHMVWHTRVGRRPTSPSTPTTHTRCTPTRKSSPASQSIPRWQGRFMGQTSIRWESLLIQKSSSRLERVGSMDSTSLATLSWSHVMFRLSRRFDLETGPRAQPTHRTTTQHYRDLAGYLPGYFCPIRPSLMFTYVSLYSNVWIKYCRPSLQKRGPSGRGRQKIRRGRCIIGTRLTRRR
jgi:hypothetical protein